MHFGCCMTVGSWYCTCSMLHLLQVLLLLLLLLLLLYQQRNLLTVHRIQLSIQWSSRRHWRCRHTALFNGVGTGHRRRRHKINFSQVALDQRPQIGVLRLFVSSQIDLTLKRLMTELAGEGLVAGMLARMRYKVGALAESLSAHLALVGFFTCNEKKNGFS